MVYLTPPPPPPPPYRREPFDWLVLEYTSIIRMTKILEK